MNLAKSAIVCAFRPQLFKITNIFKSNAIFRRFVPENLANLPLPPTKIQQTRKSKKTRKGKTPWKVFGKLKIPNHFQYHKIASRTTSRLVKVLVKKQRLAEYFLNRNMSRFLSTRLSNSPTCNLYHCSI